jgi:prepilin-type N-terminal cleavage/methylation domain-containing protein
VQKLRQRLAEQRGYTLIEMVTVMAMMGVVMGGITSLFVAGTNAEVDQNNRFQAQLNARVALDKIRREVHCATSVTLSGTASNGYYPTMTENPSGCGGTQYTWCTAAVAGSTQRYRLYRQSGATCSSAAGTQFADYVTKGEIFAYVAQSSASLAKLTVDIPVNRKPAMSSETYELKDDIVLRNSTRS